MVARDDLVSKFSRSMPERVAQATELWLEYEQGKASSVATLRRLLHTLKGESHMLDLDQCGDLAERTEALVDVLLRAGQATALTGDALLGSLEGMAMLAADPYAQEAPDLGGLFEQLRAATEELRLNATTGHAKGEAIKKINPQHVPPLPRALVVENAPVARELLCGILRGLGLSVEEATDGRQGISMAKSNPPDVILTDVEMPHMDGVEMVRELKALPQLARVPIIVLTTAATKKNREHLEELGVTALLSKQEFVEERLRKLIENVLSSRK